jgi:hypothetical protein
MRRNSTILATAALAALPGLALAADPPAPATDLAAATPPTTAPAASSAPAPAAGSSDNVNYELDTARPRPAGILPRGPVSLIDPLIDDVNKQLKDAMNLELGLAYTSVWQRATDGDIKDALGADLDLFARWTVFSNPGCGNRGVLGLNGEYRHDVGNYAPRDLGDDFGSLWRTTNGYGVQDAALIQCWYEQHFADDAAVLTIGKTDPDNFYNTNRYQSDSTAFMSRMFSTNIARAHPSNGLGANLKVNLDKEFYVTGGLQDANGDKIHSGFHTIDEHEFFTAAEVGWTPTFEGWGKGAYRFTVWHSDDRDEDEVGEDQGVGISCEQEIGGGIVPFFRAGFADGEATGVDTFIGGGVGLEGVIGSKKDLTGIGVGYGDPDDGQYDSQWGAEVFHRFQLAPDVQLTLGYQYILAPSYDSVAGDDPVGVFEIRVRISF